MFLYFVFCHAQELPVYCDLSRACKSYCHWQLSFLEMFYRITHKQKMDYLADLPCTKGNWAYEETLVCKTPTFWPCFTVYLGWGQVWNVYLTWLVDYIIFNVVLMLTFSWLLAFVVSIRGFGELCSLVCHRGCVVSTTVETECEEMRQDRSYIVEAANHMLM